jgi:hypothetical protein
MQYVGKRRGRFVVIGLGRGRCLSSPNHGQSCGFEPVSYPAQKKLHICPIRSAGFLCVCPATGADRRQTLATSPASLFLGELTRVLTGHASILSAGYCLSTARASSTVPTSHAS